MSSFLCFQNTDLILSTGIPRGIHFLGSNQLYHRWTITYLHTWVERRDCRISRERAFLWDSDSSSLTGAWNLKSQTPALQTFSKTSQSSVCVYCLGCCCFLSALGDSAAASLAWGVGWTLAVRLALSCSFSSSFSSEVWTKEREEAEKYQHQVAFSAASTRFCGQNPKQTILFDLFI